MSETTETWEVFLATDPNVSPGIDTVDGDTVVCFGDGYDLCGIRGSTREQQLQRARLIAAAPDLLAACEGMLENIDNVLDDQDLMERRRAIVAAIAKAKGTP